MEQKKVELKRYLPYYRWNDAETRNLLKYLKANKPIEKTTERHYKSYYKCFLEETAIRAKENSWKIVHHKVRQLCDTYNKAKQFQRSTIGTELTRSEVLKLCPLYDDLEEIFGDSKKSFVMQYESDGVDNDEKLVIKTEVDSDILDNNRMLESINHNEESGNYDWNSNDFNEFDIVEKANSANGHITNFKNQNLKNQIASLRQNLRESISQALQRNKMSKPAGSNAIEKANESFDNSLPQRNEVKCVDEFKASNYVLKCSKEVDIRSELSSLAEPDKTNYFQPNDRQNELELEIELKREQIQLERERLVFEQEKHVNEIKCRTAEIQSNERIKILEIEVNEKIALKEIEMKQKIALKELELKQQLEIEKLRMQL